MTSPLRLDTWETRISYISKSSWLIDRRRASIHARFSCQLRGEVNYKDITTLRLQSQHEAGTVK